ncbi:YesL family protein [Alkalicoccobacillus murimartini]|uniref:Membrane protein YesL n=1 Tax=Alkalicoccobacillus murimartini TaxID=171685 RepID=A0ABT9YHA2_9BACI|nr:DUF624 domain-containing protein [Alkalicoccobacillus murimartini]MDQ0207243.1 putative membrane protein YesL [Alkalicoccobacillus murimartini]
MNIHRLGEGVMHYCEILMRLAVINLLWIGFTLFGLGLFGWAPASAAAFTVMRKSFMGTGLTGENSASIFRDFKESYKKEFVSANLFGWLIVAGLGLLVVSGRAMVLMEASMLPRMILLTVLFLFVSILLLAFPLKAFMSMSSVHTVRFALLLGVANMHYVLILCLILTVLVYMYVLFPGLVLFYGVSLPAAIIMQFALRIFAKAGLVTSYQPA